MLSLYLLFYILFNRQQTLIIHLLVLSITILSRLIIYYTQLTTHIFQSEIIQTQVKALIKPSLHQHQSTRYRRC
ncbi:hypothetical protein FGO68_gene17585 [Halteria grandinella]|uniref:Uncharacterized protein n=1 Tax=Halteria grandinella TaxID=5974 RepID=A0A8J8NDC8_HALGN|nr:hypothetical protein FGO68_gene17585 [Halteria grandinella]